MSPPIFLDNHSTTRVDPRVAEAMWPYFVEHYGNAASINHWFGEVAGKAVEAARAQISALLGTEPAALAFTSGATEANNLALKGVLHGAPADSHVITTVAEHRAVLDPAKKLQRSGYAVTLLPVDAYGRVEPLRVAESLRPNTVLVSVMAANNEVGTLSHIEEIAGICRRHGALFHCDGAQCVGKLPLDLSKIPIDLLSVTAHKLYGPKGVGALFVRRGERRIRLEAQMDGGGHEGRLRSGTLPVPLIIGFGQAAEIVAQEMSREGERVAALRDRLWVELSHRLEGLTLNGHPTDRLPGNLHFSVDGVDGDALMNSLREIAVSSGSACTTANPEPSHVLRAMGVADARSRSSLRFGIGRFNTLEEIEFAAGYVEEQVRRLRD